MNARRENRTKKKPQKITEKRVRGSPQSANVISENRIKMKKKTIGSREKRRDALYPRLRMEINFRVAASTLVGRPAAGVSKLSLRVVRVERRVGRTSCARRVKVGFVEKSEKKKKEIGKKLQNY